MDYEKYCWYCGDATMKPVGSYYQCSSCGATWSKPPQLTTFIDVESHRDGQGETPAYRPVKRRPRTGVLKRRG